MRESGKLLSNVIGNMGFQIWYCSYMYTRLQTVWSLPGPSRQANKDHNPRCHRRPNGPGRLADKVVQPTTQSAEGCTGAFSCYGTHKGQTILSSSARSMTRLVPRFQKIRDPGFAESKVWDLDGSWTLHVLFVVGLWKPRTSKF